MTPPLIFQARWGSKPAGSWGSRWWTEPVRHGRPYECFESQAYQYGWPDYSQWPDGWNTWFANGEGVSEAVITNNLAKLMANGLAACGMTPFPSTRACLPTGMRMAFPKWTWSDGPMDFHGFAITSSPTGSKWEFTRW